MSTNTTNTTPAKWQNCISDDLPHGTVMLISSHWEEITRYLAPPGVAWGWSDSGVSHRVKSVLKDRKLIRRAPGGERWVTTMELWCYVIEKAGDDEPVGTDAVGQQMLAVPDDTSRPIRVLTDTNTKRINRARQSTLAGGVTDPDTDTNDTEEETRKPWRKDPMWSKPTSKELAASHPSQARLAAWVTENSSKLDEWDVDTTGPEGELSQPRGRVYYPAAPLASPGGQARLTAFTAGQWSVTIPG